MTPVDRRKFLEAVDVFIKGHGDASEEQLKNLMNGFKDLISEISGNTIRINYQIVGSQNHDDTEKTSNSK